MVIKNKDGSVFSLRRPNPLANEQVWRDMIFHNCNWDGETVPDTTINPPPKKFTDLPTITIPEAIDELPIIPKPKPETKPEPKHLADDEQIPEKVLKNLVKVYCLPAILETEKDELYDEEREVMTYGKKFSFEAIMTARTDLALQMWTRSTLPKQSIIYPSVFVKGEIKFGDYRWWKITEIEEKSGGYMLTAIPSELQPDFS